MISTSMSMPLSYQRLKCTKMVYWGLWKWRSFCRVLPHCNDNHKSDWCLMPLSYRGWEKLKSLCLRLYKWPSSCQVLSHCGSHFSFNLHGTLQVFVCLFFFSLKTSGEWRGNLFLHQKIEQSMSHKILGTWHSIGRLMCTCNMCQIMFMLSFQILG